MGSSGRVLISWICGADLDDDESNKTWRIIWEYKGIKQTLENGATFYFDDMVTTYFWPQKDFFEKVKAFTWAGFMLIVEADHSTLQVAAVASQSVSQLQLSVWLYKLSLYRVDCWQSSAFTLITDCGYQLFITIIPHSLYRKICIGRLDQLVLTQLKIPKNIPIKHETYLKLSIKNVYWTNSNSEKNVK